MSDIDFALSFPTETEIILGIGKIVGSKVQNTDEPFSKLTKPEKVFVYVDLLEAQVNNGGFDQFFFNSSGDYAYQCLDAYKEINANKTAELIRKAIEKFPILPVSKDTTRRRQLMQDLDDSTSEYWNNLDSEFYKYEENIAALLIEYIKKNKSEIG